MDDAQEIIAEFLVESHEGLDQVDRDLVALEQDPQSRDLLANIFRTIHTIKGTCGFLAFAQLEELAHLGETLLGRLRDQDLTMTPSVADTLLTMVDAVRALLTQIEVAGVDTGVDVTAAVAGLTETLQAPSTPEQETAPPGTDPTLSVATADATDTPVVAPKPAANTAIKPTSADPDDGGRRRTLAESSIRVDVSLLDSLMRLVGELVLNRNQVVRQAAMIGDVDLLRATQRFNVIASELQEGFMKTRMQPMEHIWSKFPRVVRDLAAQCGKSVALHMVGRETELDRSLLESVKDPLTHLIRNAVDHGIESVELRTAAGKHAQGALTLRAFHEGGQVVIEVADDGAGIDPKRIGASAVAKGLVTADELAAMSSADTLQLIFKPGFSTAQAVTNVSGRGVGMDVVKTNIESIRGTIEIESDPGVGTTFRLRIPLTLAIVPALIVDCAGQTFTVPQVNVLELVALTSRTAASAIENVGDAEVYRLRGQLLPLIRLAAVLGESEARGPGGVIVVLHSEGRRFGLVVDRVVATEEVVVKPLSKRLDGIATFAGATILGDGRVALVLDTLGIARKALRAETAEYIAAANVEIAQAVETERMLIVGLGEGRIVAIPLTSVTRLEQIRADEIEHVGHREVVRRSGQILPIVRLASMLGQHSAQEKATWPVIVHTNQDRGVAIVVHEIVDIVDAPTAQRSDIQDSGLVGSLVIKDRVTELLDVRPNGTMFNLARTSAPGGTFMRCEMQPNHTPHADSSPAASTAEAASVSRPTRKLGAETGRVKIWTSRPEVSSSAAAPT